MWKTLLVPHDFSACAAAAHLEPRSALATSLFVVGVTSLVATFLQARAHEVRWTTGASLALGVPAEKTVARRGGTS